MAKSPDPSAAFPKARKAYEDGMPLRALKRRFHMVESELRDACPEEFEDEATERRNGY